jgi:adhesin transport system membrane fusion protein
MATLVPTRRAARPPVLADADLARLVTGAAGADALRPRRSAHLLLFTIAAFFLVMLIWADRATLDEVTRGEGRVIPSRQIQVVQNLEGGIVAAILVREGQIVDEGQVLMRIDNVRAESDYREKRARYLALLGSIARLQAEIDGGDLVFPEEVITEAPDVAARELQLHRSRDEGLESQLEILGRQAEQRRLELAELKVRIGNLETSYQLALDQRRLTAPLAQQRIVPQTQMLAIEREVTQYKSQLDEARLTVPRIETAILESERRIENARSTFRSEALREFNERRSELAGIREVILAGADRVRRTEVRSPVHGTIKQLNITTIGGVIQPGQDLVEIVPLEDSLLIEAQVRPADIAFLSPEQPAVVKITAYDYAIYGGLKGWVEDISADTITDERGQSFYRVRVRTEEAFLGSAANPLRIIPGMTAQIDVLTGEKTVLAYLMKPILRARERALRER